MEQNIQIRVHNLGTTIEVPAGATLQEVYQLSGLTLDHGPISARVNNKMEGMHYRLFKQ
jgi:uridine kinase